MKNSQGLYNPATEHDSCGVGFIVDIKGRRSHQLVQDALTILKNLLHRGACGAEKDTGDGVGILIQTPDKFFRRVCGESGIHLPKLGDYGTGLVFLPVQADVAVRCQSLFEEIIAEEGQQLLGWRAVPVDDSSLGKGALANKPQFKQIFIAKASTLDEVEFERKLYVIRKRVEHTLASDEGVGSEFYVSSLSCRTFIYKGMLTGTQLEPMFPDLSDVDLESALALVHQRFSTNTMPRWQLAQPFRYLCHNGEINTVRGNINWMRAREALCRSPLFGEELQKVMPIITEQGSDSSTLDNVMEFLHMAGRPLPHVILMMIPEAWATHNLMSASRRAFYEYHACLMEPWDGPASVAFTDGKIVGSILDRNGLRPSRYYVTHDDRVIMASEVGVLDIAPENIKLKERLHPGRIFVVDTQAQRIIDDEEIKQQFIDENPYADWLAQNIVPVSTLPKPREVATSLPDTLVQRQKAFGYTQEDIKTILLPMAEQGLEPIGSMGTDAALAVLSNRPRLLYDYFKQLFAQVTNPPLDGIREEMVTQVSTTLGPEGNLLIPTAESCRRLKIDSPVLTNLELAKIRECRHDGLTVAVVPILYPVAQGGKGLEQSLEAVFACVDQAIDEGVGCVILSDLGVDKEQAAIPALLAVSGLHHHLIRGERRTRVSLIVETAEAREVHHIALLLGYGAGAINPYLAFKSIEALSEEGYLSVSSSAVAVKNYIKAINKGLVKIMSKMGISTVQSYCGAQIFEAIGLEQEFIARYFTWTGSRIGGCGLDVVEKETSIRHSRAFAASSELSALDTGGEYQWRRDGEYHLFNPNTVFKLQHATRSGQYKIFKEYTSLVDEQNQQLATLRGLFEFKYAENPIPIEEVEPIEAILKRFSTGAMSYGSISKEAHETLAIAMNRLGGKSNTGEGGEDSDRFTPDVTGDSRRSAIKQVASGRFGVTSEYLVNADDIQIKMAQGAKPGEGGQLPGKKVYPHIAKVRFSTAGVGLISPPPHHDIYSIEDLAQLIHDLKNANPIARIHVKLVAEMGVGTVAAGVSKAHADVVLISGYDGGTGASPISSLKHAGLPWELGVAETQQVLVQNNLRDRIVVQTDGQLKTGRDIVVAALLGAEEYGFSTAPLVVMGCIMMRVCHLNTCPVGIATQNPELIKKFNGTPEFVENFFRYVAKEVREYMAKLGFRTIDEMIGRADCLDRGKALSHWKAKGLDISSLFYVPDTSSESNRYCTQKQDHGLEHSLDVTQIVPACREALDSQKQVELHLPIKNTNRAVGTILGYEITRRYGGVGLPEDTIKLNFKGSSGMSFGAFLPYGMTLFLEGDSNDYVGKGLSGGKIIIRPPPSVSFVAAENILIGNVVLYGATAGEAYFSGLAGERFCVRNSGAHAVVEGVGDHGCEYMTGGRVVIIGPTGRNFAAGMSGGIAYVYDEKAQFEPRCNLEMVELLTLDEEDDQFVRELLTRHLQYTKSAVAAKILDSWKHSSQSFVKVMPTDYRRVLEAVKYARQAGIPEEEAVMGAVHG